MTRSFAPTSSVLVAALLVSATAAFAASEVGSPNLFECSPAAIQYTCDKPPCQIIARPSTDAASSLENFGTANDATGTVSWRPVDQKAGTTVVLYITNADGEQATSAPLTVNPPNDAANAIGADGKCGGAGGASSDSSSSASSSESSSASSESSSSSGAGASASSKASSAVDSASSKGASITSKAADKTSNGDSPTATPSDAGSGAAGIFVKTSVLAAAVLAVGSVLF